MHKYLLLLLLLPLLGFFTSCEENIESETDVEYANWQARNDAYFHAKMAEARAAIATAKATYGDAWEQHCAWGILGTTAKVPASRPASTDSICYEIVERGTGTECPLYTDSVSVNYAGRLMPTDQTPKGKMFSYSGLYADEANIFNPSFAVPISFSTSNLVEGFTTALQYMHVGDRWRVYMHQSLGYGASAVSSIPTYSTLIYDMQLVGIVRE